MSFSSLYKFALSLKGRGHFLSPKEVEFLKNLLLKFSEEEIKQRLKKCFEEIIPLSEREKSSILRCRKLFEKDLKSSNIYFNPRSVGNKSSVEIFKKLSPEKRRKIILEFKKLFGNKKPSRDEIEEVLKILLRLYS